MEETCKSGSLEYKIMGLLIEAENKLAEAMALIGSEYKRAKWHDTLKERPENGGPYLVMKRFNSDVEKTMPVDFAIEVFCNEQDKWAGELPVEGKEVSDMHVVAWRYFDTAGMPEGV